MNIFEITLDVDKRANKESVNLRQGDINGTTIRATLRDHDVPMEGGDYTGAFCMTLPDRKTYYWTEADYADGVVSVVVDERVAAAVPGNTNNAYFELYDGDELKYTTASFIVRIKAAASEVGEAAQSYDLRVERIMGEMRELIDTETESEAGRVEAEEGRVAAESIRESTFTTNEQARQSTFDVNEQTRQRTFVANEQARADEYDSAMTEWTLAETDRADEFSESQSARQSAFELAEANRQQMFSDTFVPPAVSVEETDTGQVLHVSWHDTTGQHVTDVVIDDAISVTITGDTLAIPVDPDGVCTASGSARFYYSGWVGNRMVACRANATSVFDPRFSVRTTPATATSNGSITVNYTEGTMYPVDALVCAITVTCADRDFLHRISAVAPRGGRVSIDESIISHESFQSFCEALARAANLTISESWNTSTQQYDYTITSEG